MAVTPAITDEQFYTVIADIADGVSITAACSKIQISTASFYQYKRIMGDEAQKEYVRAVEQRAISRVEKIENLCELCEDEVRNIEDPKRANAIVQAYKIRIDAIKWQSSKEHVKAYGDKIEHSGDVNLGVINFPVRAKENAQQ